MTPVLNCCPKVPTHVRTSETALRFGRRPSGPGIRPRILWLGLGGQRRGASVETVPGRPPASNVPSVMPLSASEEVEEWKVVCGKFLAINATNMSCACPRSPRGLSPAAHLGDGSSDLILIRKCSRFNFLRFLVRHTNQYDQVSGGLVGLGGQLPGGGGSPAGSSSSQVLLVDLAKNSLLQHTFPQSLASLPFTQQKTPHLTISRGLELWVRL